DLFAVVTDLAVAGGDDLALLGLFLGGIGDDDAAFLDLLLLQALHENAVVQRTNLHHSAPPLVYELSWYAGEPAPPDGRISSYIRRVLTRQVPGPRKPKSSTNVGISGRPQCWSASVACDTRRRREA